MSFDPTRESAAECPSLFAFPFFFPIPHSTGRGALDPPSLALR
jgi:hypothetical protein